jgi:hypothetical protein
MHVEEHGAVAFPERVAVDPHEGSTHGLQRPG